MAGAGELEGSSLVLKKNDSEDYCGDQEESDIISLVISRLFLGYDITMQIFR